MKTNANKNQKVQQLGVSEPETIDLALRRLNRGLGQDKLLELLRDKAPDLYRRAEVVEKWVWIRFDQKQPAAVTTILSEFGFHWNRRRKVWQHPCGVYHKHPMAC